MASQNLNAERVKRRNLRFGLVFFSDHLGKPLLHFQSGLIRKSHAQDSMRRNAHFNQFGNSKRYHPCLSRTGPRQDQERSGKRVHSVSLSWIQSGHSQSSPKGQKYAKNRFRLKTLSVCDVHLKVSLLTIFQNAQYTYVKSKNPISG